MRDLTGTRSLRALQSILRTCPLTADETGSHHDVPIREQHDLTYFTRVIPAFLVKTGCGGRGGQGRSRKLRERSQWTGWQEYSWQEVVRFWEHLKAELTGLLTEETWAMKKSVVTHNI